MLPALSASVREVLCLGAHCDDVEIGCRGTLAQLRSVRPDVRVKVVVFPSDPDRRKESESALARLAGRRGPLEVRCLGVRDGYFPSQTAKHWFTADTFLGFMRLRGLECRAASGYAEVFHKRKVLLDFGGVGARSSEEL